MMHPSFKAATGHLPTELTPVYPTSAGLPQAFLRRAIAGALSRADLSESLPSSMAWPKAPKVAQTVSLRQALTFLHHPTPDVSIAALEDRSHPAWQRLKAEELLAQQLSQRMAKMERDALRAPALQKKDQGWYDKLREVLPFQLTSAQQRVGLEIAQDLARPVPMHRLLQGDVGAGKTVVAALAAMLAIDGGWQCALMAPTEILAQQHFAKLVGWLSPLGVRVAWLTGSQKKKERTEMLALIESGEAALVVGTHAVIQEQVKFRNLGFAIIDEQHRFGVAQRLALRDKMQDTGMEPHLLMMTATPIPRTLAMSYYADLEVSVIDELPPGRTPVVTKVISDSRRDQVIGRIGAQLAEGRQVYWVCPLIEESEALDLTNATATHEELSAVLPGVTVGLLHSRMSVQEKREVMAQFTQGTMGVLVSTTVIEVGVDVPNASLMVIEHAERFGLSQLHQLRGRVGRGAAASACVLLYGTPEGGRLSETARERLRAMVDTNDGFEIARRDLEIRGPGEFLGARQSGAALLRFADLSTDEHLLEWARQTAPVLIDKHPDMAERQIARWLGGKSEFLKA
jgi:ATP-dependent DNA helicase RecG